jgi:argininosuccinate synthase
MRRRIVLAYTGSLQTSMAIRALAEVDGTEVVTLTLDLGQGRDLEEVRDRALATGAVRAHVLDVREEFARDFVLPALRVGAMREGRHPLGEALAWPLVATKLVDIASVERAAAVAHGCTGGDEERMSKCVAALDPQLEVIAAGCGDVAQRAHANLWGRAHAVIVPRVEAPDRAAYVEIVFEHGVPVAINGVPMPLTEVIESLSVIAGQHGIGWLHVGRPEDGALRDRDYEAPAAVVLHAARRALDAALIPADLLRLKQDRAIGYAHLVTEGLWFTEGRQTMDALNVKMEEKVNGTVRITLFKGTLLTTELIGVGQDEVART